MKEVRQWRDKICSVQGFQVFRGIKNQIWPYLEEFPIHVSKAMDLKLNPN